MDQKYILDVLLTIVGLLLTGMAGIFLSEFKELRKSVEALNVTIGAVVEKINGHEIRIEKLEVRRETVSNQFS